MVSTTLPVIIAAALPLFDEFVFKDKLPSIKSQVKRAFTLAERIAAESSTSSFLLQSGCGDCEMCEGGMREEVNYD